MYAFRHYNPEEIIMGKTMKRTFTICCSILAHYDTRRFRSFWKAVNKRSWLGESPMETAKRVIAFFEILEKARC